MRILILTLLFISSSAFAQQKKINFCHQALADTTNLTFTEIFFAYLNELHKESMVTNKTLKILKVDLERQHTLSNPVNKNSSDYEIHKNMVQDYLLSPDLDRAVLLKLLTDFLSAQEETKADKSRSAEKTKLAARKMNFNLVRKGSFPEMRYTTMGEGASLHVGLKEFQTEIPHSFLMMDTKVTRHFWMEIYGAIPIDNTSADFPMTKVTFLSAMAFANELSRREGLKPAYILDPKILNPDTKAEDGTLALADSIELPYDFSLTTFIDAPNGDIYQTEGYRLPTVEEQFFVRTNRGQVRNTELFPEVKNFNNVFNYAWLLENSGELQGVANRLPFVIEGKDFYDLYGNATEYSQTHLAEVFSPIAFGSSFTTHKIDVLNMTFILQSVDLRHSNKDMGFRLVRTVKEKKP